MSEPNAMGSTKGKKKEKTKKREKVKRVLILNQDNNNKKLTPASSARSQVRVGNLLAVALRGPLGFCQGSLLAHAHFQARRGVATRACLQNQQTQARIASTQEHKQVTITTRAFMRIFAGPGSSRSP